MSLARVPDEAARDRERNRRRDYGSVRLSQRDGVLLRLIAEQYAISVDQLARVIGRSHRTGRWLRDRWRHAGWVESRQLTSGGPSFIWLTRHGTRIAQSPYRTWQPHAGLIGHIEAVTELRLLLDRHMRLGAWRCERSLAKEHRSRSQSRPHLPDAVLRRNQETIALEVELTLKSRARLGEIVAELAEQYAQVWYFAAAALLRTLSEIAAEVPYENVRVYSYPPRASELLR
jgi:hypothetical protein